MANIANYFDEKGVVTKFYAKYKTRPCSFLRSEVYAHAYCRISSYLQTMASKGINPLIAIQMALAGENL